MVVISDPVSTYAGAVRQGEGVPTWVKRAGLLILALVSLGWSMVEWRWAGALVWGLTVSAGLAAWRALKCSYVQVAEKEVAVVYNASRRAFSRFLPPGRYWLLPGVEKVVGVISTRPRVEGGECRSHTAEGIAVTVRWKATYHLDPLAAADGLRPNMARTLRRNPEAIVGTHAPNCIQHLLESHPVAELHAAGMQRRLENRLRGLVGERLRPFGFVVHRVILDEIQLPEPVGAAIEAAYTRKLQAQAEAQSLAIRQAAIRAFTPEDIQRLIELERLRVLESRPGETRVLLGQYHPVISDHETIQWPLAAQAAK